MHIIPSSVLLDWTKEFSGGHEVYMRKLIIRRSLSWYASLRFHELLSEHIRFDILK